MFQSAVGTDSGLVRQRPLGLTTKPPRVNRSRASARAWGAGSYDGAMSDAMDAYNTWSRPLGLDPDGATSIASYGQILQDWGKVTGQEIIVRGESKYYPETFCQSKLGRHEDRASFKPLSEHLGRPYTPGPGQGPADSVLFREEVAIVELFRQWFSERHVGVQLPPQFAIQWLDLAQHYGAPTRLLDVSVSPSLGCFSRVGTALLCATRTRTASFGSGTVRTLSGNKVSGVPTFLHQWESTLTTSSG